MTRNAENDAPRATVDEALAAWEASGPTSLTVALMADALYGAREGAVLPPAAVSEQQPAENDTLLRLTQHLASEWVDGGGRCDLTADKGMGRCEGTETAIRWEGGFADIVCETHAESARERGALVVYPHRHDGTTTPIPPVRTRPVVR